MARNGRTAGPLVLIVMSGAREAGGRGSGMGGGGGGGRIPRPGMRAPVIPSQLRPPVPCNRPGNERFILEINCAFPFLRSAPGPNSGVAYETLSTGPSPCTPPPSFVCTPVLRPAMAPLVTAANTVALLALVGVVAATCGEGDNFDPDTGKPCGAMLGGGTKCEACPCPLLASLACPRVVHPAWRVG